MLLVPPYSGLKPDGHAGFGADLPGCCHPGTTSVLLGALLGVFLILLIFSASLLFGSLALSAVCYLCCFKCQQLSRILQVRNLSCTDGALLLFHSNSSVLKFVSRSKMFEKVTCCFSLWNLESKLGILF